MSCILCLFGISPSKKINKIPPVVIYEEETEIQDQNEEVEIFRLNEFDPTKNYAFALYKKQKGTWPDDRYYTIKGELQYLGKWINKERWGYHDNAGGAETFINNKNGEKTRIVYDYVGKTCFVEL